MKGFLAVFAMCSMMAALATAQPPGVLRVAAAADLQPLLPALLAEFQQKTGIRAEASYASSSTLAQQILNGAPFDLFLSADTSFPQKIIAAGLADGTTPTLYAKGTLVLWARKDSPVQPLTLASLRTRALKRLAVADAGHAPYGRAAKAYLEHADLMPLLASKLVVAENIAQTAQYASSGNADAALISLTSALAAPLRDQGTYVLPEAGSYPAILQGAVVVAHREGSSDAHKLLDFLLSPAVQVELQRGGLSPPTP